MMNDVSSKLIYGSSIFNAGRLMTGGVNVIFLMSYGISLKEIAYLQIVFSISILLLEYPTGLLSDRWNRKWMVLWGIFFTSVFYLILPNRPDFPYLIIAEILYALGLSFISGSFEGWAQTEAQRVNKDYEKMAHKWIEIGALMSLISGSTGIFIVYYIQNFPAIYYIAFSILLSSFIVFLLTPKPNKNSTKAFSHDKILSVRYLKELIHLKYWRYYTLMAALLSAAMQPVYHFWQPIFVADDISNTLEYNTQDGLFLFLAFALTFTSQFLFNRFLSDSYKRRTAIILFALLCSFCAFAIALIPNSEISFTIILLACFTFLHGLSSCLVPSIQGVLANNHPQHSFASAFSATNSISRIAAITVLFLASNLVEKDDVSATFILSAFCFIALAIVCSISMLKPARLFP